jgi:hypothetical protein
LAKISTRPYALGFRLWRAANADEHLGNRSADVELDNAITNCFRVTSSGTDEASVGYRDRTNQGDDMRKLILATMAAAIITAPMATVVKAEDTTIIKKDNDGDRSKTVIKKSDDVNMLPVPHTEEKKTIIKKESDD